MLVKYCRVMFFGFFITTLSACSLFQPKPAHLLTTCSDATPIVAQQQWQVDHEQEHYLLQVISERSTDHWQWILISSLGQRLVTVTGKAGVIQVEREQSHPALDFLPELLDAWQYSFWPLADLQQQSPAGWQFTENSHHREALFSGILRATIDYSQNAAASPWQSSLTFDNKKRALHLRIESQLLN